MERLPRQSTPEKKSELREAQFTVYRPKTIRPQVWYPMLAFTHLAERRPETPRSEPDPIEQVRAAARQVLGEKAREYRDTSVDARQAVPESSQIMLQPVVPGIEFNPAARSFLWIEDVHREEFRLRAGTELDGQVARGRLSVYLGAILLAEVDLAIKVDSTCQSMESTPREPDIAKPYRKIFASYSHKDAEIVQQYESFGKTLGDKYLRDVRDLKAGENWDEALLRLIDEADIFQLFWSTNSMHSPFVRREWEYALTLSKAAFIRPTYWEEPLPEAPDQDLPPEVLRRLHFQRIALGPVPAPLPSAKLVVPQEQKRIARCGVCGTALYLPEEAGQVAKCGHCGTPLYLPKAEAPFPRPQADVRLPHPPPVGLVLGCIRPRSRRPWPGKRLTIAAIIVLALVVAILLFLANQ